ncbi:unnamed protein product [Peniophora sp. CBMAI 1063]|nr:unnamed protein product [Peniophora sp. CBMAI 1063]
MPPKPRMVRKNAPTSTAMPGPSMMAAMGAGPVALAPAAAPAPQIPPSTSTTLGTGRSTPTGVSPGKGLSTATNTSKSSPMAANSSKGSPMAASASKNSPKPGNAGKSMPPPPAPSAPKAILEAEVDAMSRAFRTAAVKTGQIYGFYADTAKLGIQNYAPRPPASLTTGLARHVEQYDQLCDRVEAHLLRAIAVLQRDLQRERAAQQAEEEARMAVASPEPEPAAIEPPPSASLTAPEMSPPLSASGMSQSGSGRRPSTISLSSLNRPQFAHKLDLSDSTLQFSPDSLSAATGLDAATLASLGRPPSPITLAPKSARALELGADFMGLLESAGASSNVDRPVDIDLTLDEDVVSGPGAGSADQPIELDLDMDMDLFGDPTSSLPDVPVKKEPGTEGLDMDLLNSLAPKDDAGQSGADLLAQLGQAGDAGGSADFNLDMSTLPGMNMDVSGNLNMDLGMGSGMDLSTGGGMNLGEGSSMDVGMDMNLDFSGVPLSDVDFSNVSGGEGVDMLDMDALLGSSSATGDGAGASEVKDGGTS